jgi:hypothetical protein
LQPAAAIDYENFNRMTDRAAMTGEWLAHCRTCPVPEIANIFHRAGISFHQITGMLHEDPVCWNEVEPWLDAARVASRLLPASSGRLIEHYALHSPGRIQIAHRLSARDRCIAVTLMAFVKKIQQIVIFVYWILSRMELQISK